MSIIALFDMSGISVELWAEAGYKCYCLDILNKGGKKTYPSGGSVEFIKWDANDPKAIEQVLELSPEFIMSFPPCTDLAISGSKHFETKRAFDSEFQRKAMKIALMAHVIADYAGRCPYTIENPVGVISTWWKKSSYIFDPCDYGGYLPIEDEHPLWPRYIAARDAYFKKTCIWLGNGAKKPRINPINCSHLEKFNNQTQLLGGKSLKTKIIRSMTPRGWARANFIANERIVKRWSKFGY